jgi:hypothetical protein
MADFLIPEYRLGQQQQRGAAPGLSIEAPVGAFGGIGAQQLVQAGQTTERAGDRLQVVFEREAELANNARVDELNNQFLDAQTKLLSTDKGAFYTKQGSDAIHAAEPTVKALQELRTNILGQTANAAQKADLSKRLSYHVNDATASIGRHVANQSLVWRDQVAKGTVMAGTNQMAANYNDPEKVALHGTGIWQTEYDRALKQLGDTPEGQVAAKASADAVRSNAMKAVITLQAVDNPAMAQRTLDKHRDWLDATDVPALSATIKDAAQKRKTQDIVGLVTATGGISPNYNARTQAAEGGDTTTENKIGALGKYQMIPGTYTDLAQGTEWGKGKSQAEVRALLLEPKVGGQRQDELKRLYDDRSLKALSDKGLPVNDLTLYTTHFLGHGAGPEILKLPDDTPLQAGLLKAHGGDAAFVKKVIDANPFLAKVETVGDLKALMAQKIGAPLTLATTGSPQKPNLDAMLASGLAMAGSDPDLRDRVTAAIKTDYATKHAIYTAQIGGLEKQAFAHIDAGGTIENLPSAIRGGLDSDGLTRVQQYEEKRIEKRRKENAEAASKRLTDLEVAGQLAPEDVKKEENNLPGPEYRSRMKIAMGEDRIEDPQNGAYERLQRGLGTRDMRDEIFTSHSIGDINKASRDSLLDKNAAFLKESAPATPYKINHDRLTRSLSVGIADNPIARELFGKAMKEFDIYVKENPQREGETQPQYSKRLDDYTEGTARRYSMIKFQDIAATQPVPAHTPFNRSEMQNLPRLEATARITAANSELKKKYENGEITEDQYGADAVVLEKWLKFLNDRPELPKPKATP